MSNMDTKQCTGRPPMAAPGPRVAPDGRGFSKVFEDFNGQDPFMKGKESGEQVMLTMGS
jgi:hypothetical protein